MTLLEETIDGIEGRDLAWRQQAEERLNQLTMPHWALGRVMDLAVDLAGMTRSLTPPLARRTIVTMAADHGVASEGVSQYPQEVTPQMVHNFAAGGAAINALAKVAGARLVVVDMGVAGDLVALVESGAVLDRKVRGGTDNIAQGPPMDRDEARRCVEAGIELARELAAETDLFSAAVMEPMMPARFSSASPSVEWVRISSAVPLSRKHSAVLGAMRPGCEVLTVMSCSISN
jgi:nicotinate-nucleotide--dimethylbenzimidazole phosphoribosyltransferase